MFLFLTSCKQPREEWNDVGINKIIHIKLQLKMKVKNDNRSEFSSLSNCKEEAWKNQGFKGIRTCDLCEYQWDALPTDNIGVHGLSLGSYYTLIRITFEPFCLIGGSVAEWLECRIWNA